MRKTILREGEKENVNENTDKGSVQKEEKTISLSQSGREAFGVKKI